MGMVFVRRTNLLRRNAVRIVRVIEVAIKSAGIHSINVVGG